MKVSYMSAEYCRNCIELLPLYPYIASRRDIHDFGDTIARAAWGSISAVTVTVRE